MNHKRPLMNLRKFIIDCKAACKSTCLLVYSENLSIFFLKRTYTHLDTPPPLPVPVRFYSLFNDPPSPLLNERTF